MKIPSFNHVVLDRNLWKRTQEKKVEEKDSGNCTFCANVFILLD